jgi:threonine/homoserine/homoserine lactone efflux protein
LSLAGDTLLALVSFAFVSSITPGPNNIMLTASGVNFGFVRTIPHMLGIGIGFMVLLLAIGSGIGTLFTLVPGLDLFLKIAGAAYLLWLAWKVARSGEISEHVGSTAKPMTFVQAAAFQWINPKAWVMAVSAMALFVRPENAVFDVLMITVVFGFVNVPCVSAWAAFGHALRGFLRDPVRARIFNIAMAILLVASIVPMVR